MMTTDEAVQELLDRTRRLETRLVQLGDFVGANLRTRARIDVVLHDEGMLQHHTPYVRIDALDVSVSRIVTELRQHNVRRGEVGVFLARGSLAFSINLDECTK